MKRYKKYYYRSDKNTPNKKKFVKKIFTYQKKIKDHLLFKIDKTTTKKINYKFSKIKNILSKRHQNHRLYDKYLDKKNIIFPKLQDGSVSWRFCFLLKNKRDEFVQYLRSKNIDVSTWYPSLHYLKKYKSSDFKKAIKIDTSIINLWTDEKKRISVLKKDIQVINNFFKTMILSAHQLNYLPYAGLLSKINSSDKFLYLSKVQFEKKSWQSRNRILSKNKDFLLSVPVINKNVKQLIADVRINNKINWKKKTSQKYRN